MKHPNLSRNPSMLNARLLVPIMLTLALPAVPAAAQNALGDGHALDGNLSTRGTRNTETGRVRAEQDRFSLSQRAESGRGFNQTIGFKSNEDFRNANSEMAFYADSLYNNPWYWQNLGNLTTELAGPGGGSGGLGAGAANRGGGFYNPYFYNSEATNPGRFSMGQNIGDYGHQRNAFGGVSARDVSKTDYINLEADDRTRPIQYGIGEPNRFLQDNRRGDQIRNDYDLRDVNTNPNYVGVGMAAADVPVRYAATTLQGIEPLPYPQSRVEMGLSQYDMARIQEDRRLGRGANTPGTMWRPNFDALSQIDNRILTDADGNRIEDRAYETMDQLLMTISDRYDELRNTDSTTDPGALTMLQNDYRNVLKKVMDGYGMQEAPMGLQPGNIAGTGMGDDLPGVGAETLPTSPPTPDTPPVLGGVPEDETPGVPDLMPLEEFGQVLRHGQKVDSLATDDKTRVSELILAGQDKLHAREYYWAERRFNRALRFEPGNPLATTGLAHSQLGGGLYLSSALTLQSLLGFQPEMIDVIYDETLLPHPEDMDRAVRELTRRLTAERDSDRYAFLLAYIGHQTNNQAMVEQGLREMRRVQGDEAFLELLEEIWLPEDKALKGEEIQIIPLDPVEDSAGQGADTSIDSSAPAPPKDAPEPTTPPEPVGGELLDD